MQEKLLYLIATFDQETTNHMRRMEQILEEAGFIGSQTKGIAHHITLAAYETDREEEIHELLREVCSKTESFELRFNHIGLFGLQIIFLAPDVNSQLLALQQSLDSNSIQHKNGWSAHATLLIDEPEKILKALPLVAEHFQYIKARVEEVSLYEFFPSRLIAKYKLQ